jgi:hypothetical protein
VLQNCKQICDCIDQNMWFIFICPELIKTYMTMYKYHRPTVIICCIVNYILLPTDIPVLNVWACERLHGFVSSTVLQLPLIFMILYSLVCLYCILVLPSGRGYFLYCSLKWWWQLICSTRNAYFLQVHPVADLDSVSDLSSSHKWNKWGVNSYAEWRWL